jgi:hypothetical protein
MEGIDILFASMKIQAAVRGSKDAVVDCCVVALKELLLVKGANGFNFENQLAIEKSVGLLAGDAMRSGDLLPWWGVQVAETGREKRLLKDVLMCFGGHQCADWTKIVGRLCGKRFGERGVKRVTHRC